MTVKGSGKIVVVCLSNDTEVSMAWRPSLPWIVRDGCKSKVQHCLPDDSMNSCDDHVRCWGVMEAGCNITFAIN